MIYVAGPMTGLPENSVPTFKRIVKGLRDKGLQVVCPTECARTFIPGDEEYISYVRGDLVEMIGKCNSIALMDGWENSKGGTAEALNAVLLKMEVWLVKENTGGEIICTRARDGIRERIIAAFLYKHAGEFIG